MDPLYELLEPYFERDNAGDHRPLPLSPRDAQTTSYFTRLSTLSLPDLSTTEPASLLHAAQSHLRNLQALSKRSQKAVIASSSHLANLSSILPAFQAQAQTLKNDVPQLESVASDFAAKYSRNADNPVLDRRKQTLLLSRNVDRVSDVLELPTLLSSTVSASQTAAAATTSSASAATSYASALDLHAHIKRLSALYPQSQLVHGIADQAESEIHNLTSILILLLQSPSLKLAGAMRTVGWLRRVAPDLADDGHAATRPNATSTKAFQLTQDVPSDDGTLGSVFLVCRLRTLNTTLDALEPLRDLADQETHRRKQGVTSKLLKQQVSASALGSQSEKYLKRYIEIFREQSFNIISMHKSIFPSGLPTAEYSSEADEGNTTLPSPLASFALHLVNMLTRVLDEYVPNVADKQARESLLTQVLYCAGSLGRLGADFGMVIADLKQTLARNHGDGSETSNEGPEWVQVMKKHRVQASRLEILSRAVGSRKVSTDALSPSTQAAVTT